MRRTDDGKPIQGAEPRLRPRGARELRTAGADDHARRAHAVLLAPEDVVQVTVASDGVEVVGDLQAQNLVATAGIYLNTSTRIISGTGSPAGAISAPVGSLYLRTDGGANTTLYVKESGTGTSGWAAK